MDVDDRPLRWRRSRGEHLIEGAVIHAMGEQIVVGDEEIDAWDFLDRSPDLIGSTLSVHALIPPEPPIIRCVPDDAIAFHAGHSRFGQLESLNQTFLGAEFLLPGVWDYGRFKEEMLRGNVGYTDAQYEMGGWLYAHWMLEHSFERYRVAPHSQVSGDAVRGERKGKIDPGVSFNHGRLTNEINRNLKEMGDT